MLEHFGKKWPEYLNNPCSYYYDQPRVVDGRWNDPQPEWYNDHLDGEFHRMGVDSMELPYEIESKRIYLHNIKFDFVTTKQELENIAIIAEDSY